MGGKGNWTTWAFLAALSVLFILSARSPRAWQKTEPPPVRAVTSASGCPGQPVVCSTPVISEEDSAEDLALIAAAASRLVISRAPAEGLADPQATVASGENREVRPLSPPQAVRSPSVASAEEGDGPAFTKVEPFGPIAGVVPEPETAGPRLSTDSADAVPQPPERPLSGPPSLDSSSEGVESEDIATTTPETTDLREMDKWLEDMIEPAEGLSVLVEPSAVAPPGTPPVESEPQIVAPGNSVARADTERLREVPATVPAPEEKATVPEEPWPTPTALLAELQTLSEKSPTQAWATQADRLVRALEATQGRAASETGRIIQQLEQSAVAAGRLADKLKDQVLARRVRRAGYALNRRLGFWKGLAQTPPESAAEPEDVPIDAQQLAVCLRAIDEVTRDSGQGRAWRDFLLVDALKEMAGREAAKDAASQRLAQQVMRRLSETPMSATQRQFLASRPLTALRTELRAWAAEPVAEEDVLEHVERYEQTGLPSDAQRLARDRAYLEISPEENGRSLGQGVETHYRNANIRIAVSEVLLNRLIPQPSPEVAPVRDTVLGLPVRGRSRTSSDLAVRMLPDPNRVRLAVEVTGSVDSLTSTTSGPATFYSDSEAMYWVRKPLEVNLLGIRLEDTQVGVYNKTRLRNLETDFDFFPVLGSLVKGMARSQHEQKRPAANREVRHKIAARARQRLDEELTRQLTDVAHRLNDRVLEPVHALALEPALIDAETTEQRFCMRLRLAGQDQLGSHTPRPQAPADSLASLQVHETAINNVLARLELEGRTFTLPALSRHVASRLKREPWEANPSHDDVTITFAERDAAYVRCRDGKMMLTVSIARLAKPPRRWKDFQVRAFYEPRINGRSADLVREDVIHLIGKLSVGAQIALRGVFTKAFSKNAPWSITPERLITDPNLKDLEITQMVIDDGWIGAALGPKRAAARLPLDPQR